MNIEQRSVLRWLSVYSDTLSLAAANLYRVQHAAARFVLHCLLHLQLQQRVHCTVCIVVLRLIKAMIDTIVDHPHVP